jgi:hypothetical protein
MQNDMPTPLEVEVMVMVADKVKTAAFEAILWVAKYKYVGSELFKVTMPFENVWVISAG